MQAVRHRGIDLEAQREALARPPRGGAARAPMASSACRSKSVACPGVPDSIRATSSTSPIMSSRVWPALRTVRTMSCCSLVEAGAAQQVGHADDRVQRRAQLVAHGREEAALGAARLLGARERVGQLGQQRGGIGRQHQQREPEAGRRAPAGRASSRSRRSPGRSSARLQRRRHQQVAAAVAEAHAEGDPEVERVEHRRGARRRAAAPGSASACRAPCRRSGAPAAAPGRNSRWPSSSSAPTR